MWVAGVRIVFAGTPEPAVPSLERLIRSPRHDVIAVITRPDAVAGRGRKVVRSPIGPLADSQGIEVLTPERPTEPEFLARLTDLAPDCAPVVAYGAGAVAETLGGARVWVLPNPSGLNAHYGLPELTRWMRRLRRAGAPAA